MPGGRGDYIPTHCRDANGRKLTLFNPAMRRNESPAGTDFTLVEWQNLLASLNVNKLNRRQWLVAVVPFAIVFGIPTWLLVDSHIPIWWAVPLATFPLWAALLFKGIASRSLGVVAFVNISEDSVVSAMLKRNRCPSCAYRLPYATPDRRATCSECGAVWRSRNFRTSPPPPP